MYFSDVITSLVANLETGGDKIRIFITDCLLVCIRLVLMLLDLCS